MGAVSSQEIATKYVNLNVGGTPYVTSLKTLTRYKDSLFGEIFSQDEIPLAKDEQGRFLIDRDGTIFRYVLNFLRDGELILPAGFSEDAQLLAEARFYQLHALEDKLSFLLNVGGVPYKIYRVTLLNHKGSWLEQTLNQTFVPLVRDPQGRYLILRDGELFRYILNLMKDGQLHLPAKFTRFAELRTEAQHYCSIDIDAALTVHLSVGGVHYTTNRITLTKYPGSLLEEWFSQTSVPLEYDQRGSYIIEGDVKFIMYLMNHGVDDWLKQDIRNGVKGTGKKILQALKNFGLVELHDEVERDPHINTL